MKGGFVLCFLALVPIEGVEELGFATGSVRVFLLSWPMGVNLKTVCVCVLSLVGVSFVFQNAMRY